jgi:adenine phosphoribosyltransferase
MKYEINIAGVKRELTLFKVADNLNIAAFIMLGDVEITVHSAAELLKKAPEFDVLLTAECKSIPLVYEMAKQSGKPYVVARKGLKVYMENVITAEVNSITTAHPQVLHVDEVAKNELCGKRVLIADDVISTGESLKCLELLCEKAGGNLVGKMAVLAEGDAADREDIIYLEPLPLFDRDGNKL